MHYFLIVYDQDEGAVRLLRPFDPEDRAAALVERFRLEEKYRTDPRIEVVLLGSPSEETLRKTHARYFASVSELVGSGADSSG